MIDRTHRRLDEVSVRTVRRSLRERKPSMMAVVGFTICFINSIGQVGSEGRFLLQSRHGAFGRSTGLSQRISRKEAFSPHDRNRAPNERCKPHRFSS
ncbi:hypothetical protein RB150 [Rhodopirellula baltica SH 1]|uniref:Uncharacterized protein n=1 Tax=Rhodopirellula baltica (strain DSM 10527 / NCIMB 13988 / SH1) TaxID=243090 RepID=Q7UZ69_RHOBA|nr:hypothetical protein RB150 [Rhodopirellula baltica SH 1]